MPSLVERLTGKRSALPIPHDDGLSLTTTSTSDSGSNSKARLGHDGQHRRESSLLSLTTSVTDLGSNVRRSVSLRSHRTSPSTGSSFGARVVRSPLRTASPRPSSGEGNLHLHEESSTVPLDSAATQPPPLRRKISLSAKTLQHKFRSTEALPKINTAVFFDGAGGNVRSSPASAVSQQPPMLVGSTAGSTPAGSKRIPPPELQTQNSFSRDAHSSHGAGNGALLQPVPSLSTASLMNSNSIYNQIQETSAKRMATIDYMRRIHEGDIYFFGTFHYSSSSLSSIPSLYPHKLGRRATNYFILGYSLPALLDMNTSSPLEYLKALSSLLSEFETFQNLSGFDASGNTLSKGRMGNMFKSSMGLGHRGAKGRRSSTVTSDSSASGMDGRQADLLGIPSSASSRQSSFSNSFGSGGMESPQDMTSPINPTNHEFSFLLTPHIPFEPDFQVTLGTLCDTLIDAYAKLIELIAGPESCTPTMGAEFAKADKAIRKILVANVVREFEDSTRAAVKAEVAGLGKLVLGGLM
ncbi:uncharacterized protein RCC_06860 [Ramularia collo-cygni]|uniref:Uncharacterized protein n=1 Tax=Ramularia collo-cygni TaxID=112498 RepID=A0A2D3VGI0_9PEZI|nr:uncharacterized protein RCC_06860 [Ramularia collo-cygni]CZT20999.1 uncharacterized protein RCC_06860 [Ramularia collo-cygni]